MNFVKKKRILIVSPSKEYGGGESYLLELEKIFINDKTYEMNFIISNEFLFNKLLSHNKILNNSNPKWTYWISLLLLINKLIRKGSYSYIILNGLPEIGVYSRFINHTKVVVVCHSNENWLVQSPRSLGVKHFLKRCVSYKFYKNIWRIVVLNNKTISNFIEFSSTFKNSNQLVKIYTGIEKVALDKNIIDRRDREKIYGNNVIIFGRIGRLVSGKGNEDLIYAFNEIYKLNENIRLVFAGTGNEFTQLVKLVNYLKLNHVISFVGRISPSEFFSEIDCMVSPSYSEALPMVILEAMSCKIPIISTDVGGVAEMLSNNKSAYLIKLDPSCHISNLRNAMIDYINNQHRYINFAEKAYEDYLRRFSISAFAHQWKDLLNSLD